MYADWWFGTFFIFHFIYGIILPIDFHIFQVETTNQIGMYVSQIPWVASSSHPDQKQPPWKRRCFNVSGRLDGPGPQKTGENGGFVGFYGVKDDLTTRITGSLPCSDHNGRPNTIQHVRRWQLGFLQARLQRLTVGTALGLNGVAVTDQRPRAKELGGYVMLAFASLRANRSPSLKGTTKTGSREPPGWPF